MIENFEIITAELTEDEAEILPLIVKGLQGHGAENPIKAPEIVKTFNNYLRANGYTLKFSEVRLRKFCNHIRARGILPLIATTAGYFVSYDRAAIRSQIASLEQRANSINSSAAGLRSFI